MRSRATAGIGRSSCGETHPKRRKMERALPGLRNKAIYNKVCFLESREAVCIVKSSAMIELAIQVFEISVQVIFPTPRTFMKDRVDSDAQWLTDNASGFAIPPDQVRLRQSDVLFGYDLNVQLFGGNGYFSVDAQKASFSAKNAKSRADGQLLVEMAGRFLRHFAQEKFPIVFSANTQAKPDSKGIQVEYLHRFRFDERITRPGAVGYLQLREWPSDVRFLVEPSILADDGLFLAWTTRIPAGELSGITDRIVSVFEEAAAVYGLKLRPLV
jgi:hypothetical protein